MTGSPSPKEAGRDEELPEGVEKGSDDGPLDSLGKAITSPIQDAAGDEEPSADPRKPPVPPG